jgi:hypothetical protein
MRKLAPLGAVAVLGATAAVTLASSQATTFSLKQSTRAAGASTGIAFKIAFGDPDAPNGLPSGLRDFKITLHKGSKIDPAAAPQCQVSEADLMSKGAAACPAASRIGGGTATATPPTGGAGVTVEGVVFNEKFRGKNAWLFVFLINNAYATSLDATVKGNTITAKGLSGAVPGGLLVTKFNGTITKHSKGKHKLITAPPVCPKSKKWTNTGTFVFNNSDKDKQTSTSPCKASR